MKKLNNIEVPNFLNIGALNCQGLKDKIDFPEVYNLISSCDIFGTSETWLGENNKTDVSIDNFTFYPLNRKKIKGASRGGIGIFIKNSLKDYVKIRYDISCENFIWCKLKKKDFGYRDDVYIGFVYFPPEYSSREKKLDLDHFKHLEDVTRKIDSEHIIIMGDFNARTKNLDDVLRGEKEEDVFQINFFSKIETFRANQDHTVNKYGKQLIEYCIATQSFIANGRTLGDLQGKFTCHQTNGSSTVDYAIINETMSDYLHSFQVLDPNTGSDHSPIKMKINLPNKLKHDKSNNLSHIKKIKWNDDTKITLELQMNLSDTIKQIDNINTMLDNDSDIGNIVQEFTNIITPKLSKRKKKNKPKKQKTKKWYDYTCHEMSMRLKNVAKLYVNSPSNPHIRGSFCKTRKEYKKLIKQKKREWTSNTMISKLETAETNNPKEYWEIINELREKKHSETSFNSVTFVDFFKKLFSKDKTDNTPDEESIEEFVNKNLEIIQDPKEPDFTMEELLFAIKWLKKNKAAGPDGIPAEILKALPPYALKILLKIMNKIKDSCKYPEKWAWGITSLLFKEGDDEDPNNYRAITVADAISKILAIMLNERVEKWNLKEKILRMEQIGFKKKSRPSDHLLVLRTLVDIYHNKGKKLYACFVDFQKAFDSVWRTGMFYKFIKYGMNKHLIKLFRNMYDKTRISLKLNSRITPSFRTYKGVRQGCILSPRLFNLFINDIPDIFDSSCEPVKIGNKYINCLMYADDLILLSETETGLQNCLDRLNDYVKKWQLQIN